MTPLLRSLANRPRLLVAIAATVAAFVVLPGAWPRGTRILVAWNAGTLLYLALTGGLIARAGVETMRRRADREDERAGTILVLSVLAALVSVAAIVSELRDVRDGTVIAAGVRLGLAGLTIVSSWLFVHVMFALHYAHDFYAGVDDRRGLQFPGPARDPDYWDFLYFSITIGAASQTSDVSIVDPLTRRVVLAQTLVAFAFNTTVLALAINVGAGLIGAQ